MSGYTKPYFTDETGRLMRDETGNTDNGDVIPFEVELGRNQFGSEARKTYVTVQTDTENAREAILQYALDGGQYKTLGQLTKRINKLPFPTNGPTIEGRDISYKFVHSDAGDPPAINGVSTTYAIQERVVDEAE